MTASSPHQFTVFGGTRDFESYSLNLFWKSLLTTHNFPSAVKSVTKRPVGDTLMCLNGPSCRILSSASVESIKKTVLSTANRTSTERESVCAGGIKAHDDTSPSGQGAKSRGRGSSYLDTAISWLLDSNATRPDDQNWQALTPYSSAPCYIVRFRIVCLEQAFTMSHISEREGCKLAVQSEIASHCSVLRDDQELFLIRPA
jgi:hypothetical protein